MVLTSEFPFGDYTTEKLAARIYERHSDRIKVRKKQLVVTNLTNIITAFLKLSNKKGFHNTTLRDLADASGMSMGGLYSYFESKEDLLVMVLEEVTATVGEVLGKAPPEVIEDPRTHLLWTIEAHVRLTEIMRAWFVFAFMEAKSFSPDARKAAVDSELKTEKIIADILTRGVSNGTFHARDPAFFAALIKPLLQEWYVKRGKYRGRGIEIDRYIDEVQHLLLAALEFPALKSGHGTKAHDDVRLSRDVATGAAAAR